MKYLIVTSVFLACLCQTNVVHSADFKIKQGDTIQNILEDYKGKRITLRLMGYVEMNGKVRAVTKELVQLGELANEEFHDSIVEIAKITAVIVKVKE
ncbi:MAG: hypothetical protein VB050_04705 [Geobacteraceae bacterium]|nr:hypothetical protein [Geobacteraceae bacterium]